MAMPLRHILLPVAFLLSILFSTTSAAPSPPNLVYPIQGQRPPVARVNHTWTWTLLPDTFNASSGSTISLSSRSLPNWAAFDASTYTFSGMPSVNDEGSQYVTVQANASGVARGTSDGFVLLVVDTPAPTTRLSLAAQLPSASGLGGGATFTGDGALRVPPQWSFSLGFQQYTFEVTPYSKIYYTAYETGTTELPSWLTFDNKTVTFNGVAPRALGEYSVSVFGSDHFGYGDIEETIKIAIGYHTFELSQPLPALNTTPLDHVNYTIPIDHLLLDNATISATNLTAVTVSLAISNLTFLSYNAATRTISGTIPAAYGPGNATIPVVFSNAYDEYVVTNITLNVVASLFTTNTIPTLTVFTGQSFKDDLSAYTTSKEANYTATILPVAAQQWLAFDPTTRILAGTPPTTVPSYQNATVSLAATDLATGVRSSASLVVAVSQHVASGTSSSSSSAATPTGQLQGNNQPMSEKKKLAIGLSVGLLLGLLLLLLLALCCKRYLTKDDRKLRRDQSSPAFSQATIAAAQRATPGSSKWTQDTPGSKFTQREQEKAAEYWGSPKVEGNGRKTIDRDGSAALDAKAAVAATEAETSTKPKRIGLMGLFKAGTPKKEISQISLPMSQNSLYGLGIGDQRQPDRIVVTKVPVAPPHRVDSRDDPFAAEDDSEFDRSSSWESGGSSSLFYSDASDNEGTGRTDERPRGPPSEPRQRRDFLPLPLRDTARSPSPSPDRAIDYQGRSSEESSGSGSGSGSGGIRLVNSRSSESAGSFSSGGFESYSVIPNRMRDSFDDPRRTNSMTSMPPPRLIPFTSARTAYTSDHDQQRPTSQQAFRNPNRNSAIEDAEEGGRGTPNSGVYLPPDVEGSPTTSAVVYSTPREGWKSPRSPALSDFDENVRLVPTANNSPVPPQPSTPRTHRRTATNSTYGDPVRIPVAVNELFRFTPSMNPPPFVSITSSPGRGGPPRATYLALIDSPENPDTDRNPLPDWLHFDQNSLEMWGSPRRQDIGEVAILVLERKAMQVPGSPTRGGSRKPGATLQPEDVEQVVSRFVLDVNWKTESMSGGDDGQLQIIRY